MCAVSFDQMSAVSILILMTFILGIWRQRYIEELRWHNLKESCLYFRIKLENKIFLCTLFSPWFLKTLTFEISFQCFFFFSPRKSTSVRKIFPSWLRECCEPQTLFAELLLSCVLVQKYVFIMMLCKWLSSVKEIKRSCLCYWECENDCLLKAVLLCGLTHPWVIWSLWLVTEGLVTENKWPVLALLITHL